VRSAGSGLRLPGRSAVPAAVGCRCRASCARAGTWDNQSESTLPQARLVISPRPCCLATARRIGPSHRRRRWSVPAGSGSGQPDDHMPRSARAAPRDRSRWLRLLRAGNWRSWRLSRGP